MNYVDEKTGHEPWFHEKYNQKPGGKVRHEIRWTPIDLRKLSVWLQALTCFSFKGTNMKRKFRKKNVVNIHVELSISRFPKRIVYVTTEQRAV